MGRGIYLGVEGAGTNMLDTGELIVYKIIGWEITIMEIKGGGALEHPEHPPGYAPEVMFSYNSVNRYYSECMNDIIS